jgi:hypothetical protein
LALAASENNGDKGNFHCAALFPKGMQCYQRDAGKAEHGRGKMHGEKKFLKQVAHGPPLKPGEGSFKSNLLIPC